MNTAPRQFVIRQVGKGTFYNGVLSNNKEEAIFSQARSDARVYPSVGGCASALQRLREWGFAVERVNLAA